MKVFMSYLDEIQIDEQRKKMEEVFLWVEEKFPTLETTIKWNQPMFLDHGTFIIGFSRTKQHISFSPEEKVVFFFSDEIKKAGYEYSKNFVKIKWTDKVDYNLLKKIIDFNIVDKKNCMTFFR